MSRARASHLNQMPLQDCDLLLHESGAPPIHTPLEVLEALPEKVKERLYVVHTSALPEGTSLKIAPTGTEGTIRLDELREDEDCGGGDTSSSISISSRRLSLQSVDSTLQVAPTQVRSALRSPANFLRMSDASRRRKTLTTSPVGSAMTAASAPSDLVLPPTGLSLRPASSTDAWYQLQLLSSVPFITSLPFSSTMELLEIAQVQTYPWGSVVVKARDRKATLIVVWEGDLIEALTPRQASSAALRTPPRTSSSYQVYHAGDWSGPAPFNPGAEDFNTTPPLPLAVHSTLGAKIIRISVNDLTCLLLSGSPLYNAHLSVLASEAQIPAEGTVRTVLKANKSLRKLSPGQARHFESLRHERRRLEPGEYLWRSGEAADCMFLIADGVAEFVSEGVSGGSIGGVCSDDITGLKSARSGSMDSPSLLSLGSHDAGGGELMVTERRQRRATASAVSIGQAADKLKKQRSEPHITDEAAISRHRALGGGCARQRVRLSVGKGGLLGNVGEFGGGKHKSTLRAGEDGCEVMVYKEEEIVWFLDQHSGVHLSLLGCEVVV